MRRVEQPVVRPGRDEGDTITSHPAYAQISAGRVSGGAILYGSDIQHQHYMTIRIHKSELHRHLANDWHHSELGAFIEVAMSESQWQHFISSPNTTGALCTLQSLNRTMIPGLPKPNSRKLQFADEAQEAAREAFDRLDSLIAEIGSTSLSNSRKDALTKRAESVRSSLTSNLPFILDQFSEHMEDQVNKAKTEINGYAKHIMGPGATATPVIDAPVTPRITRSRRE